MEVIIDPAKKSQSVPENIKDLQNGIRKEGAGDRKSADPDAVFLGWQTVPCGNVFPLYNIMIKGHSLYHSTVTEDTLRKYNLHIPHIPRAFNRKIEGSGPLK